MPNPEFSLAYCTNIWTHHQAPVCTELVRLLGEDRFTLCLFEPVHEERRKMGWAATVPDDKWIAGPPSSDADRHRLCEIVCDADVAILGATPTEVQMARAATGKLTFIMGERMMRNGFFRLRMLNPRFARGIRGLRSIANNANVHYLAIGAYAAADAKLLNVFDDRIWNWAYFTPESKETFRPRSQSPVRLLWVGRFLRLKRVEMILRAMALLGARADGCMLELIGTGPTRNALKRLAKRLGLADRVCFRETTTPEVVRKRMSETDIYLFPSNHREGWGAVVGEAMSEGCVVVANKAAGASMALIEHGRTGFLFADGDVDELANILGRLIEDNELRRQVGHAAAMEMRQLWHPRVGAERLVELTKGLLRWRPLPEYSNGPCSRVTSCTHFLSRNKTGK